MAEARGRPVDRWAIPLALALVAGRQIEIDIRPLAAVFAQEALEKQFHAHGIDGSNFERITNCGVSRRPAPLHQDAVFF